MTILTSHRDRDVLRSFARRIDAGDAGAHNNLGCLYYNKGMYEEAVAAFTRALELDPRMTVAQRNLEIAYFNTGYYDRRITELRERLRANDGDREARWELGRTYALLGQAPQAEVEFGLLLRGNPEDVQAMIQLAQAEQKGGDLDQAMRWLWRALELRPDDAGLHFHLGEVCYHRGLNDDALRSLGRAIALAPDHADAHYLRGFVLGDLGRHDDARASTQRAMQLNPALGRAHANLSLERFDSRSYDAMRSAREERGMQVHEGGQLAHFNLGLAFRQKGYHTEALREYRLALDRGEERTLVLQAMAEVHLLRKDSGAAVQLYERLLEADPASPKLWNERGIALHQDGKYVDASASYEKAIACDPHYALALNNLGVALYHGGKDERSIDAFRHALHEQPAFVKARLNLALLLFKRKELQLCLEAYRQVLGLEPEQPVAWNGVGLVFSELKKFEDARNAYARAIVSRPDYAEAHYNLSFVLSNLGDFAGALRETKRALEIDPYYVAQKFELAIDLEFEDPNIQVAPDLGADRRGGAVEDFDFDPRQLETLFAELAPAASRGTPGALEGSPYAGALALIARGDLAGGAAEIARALAAGAPRGEGLILLGETFTAQGAHGEALERFREARLHIPESPVALGGEARSLLNLGRSGEARPLAEALALVLPHDVETLLLAARVRAQDGDPGAALQALDGARLLAPLRADVSKQIGDVARLMGDERRAIDAYRHALALDSDFASVRVELSALLLAGGHAAEAELELHAALESVPTYADAVLALAALHRRVARPVDTLPLLIDLLQRDPYNLDALTSLGESLFQSGRRDDARLAFERVLRFEPEHVGALYFEGVLLAETHRYREAIARWQRVIELEPACEFARRARRDARTAADLQRIFATRPQRGAA